MMTLEQGDALEIEFKDFIRTKISNYEQIWGSFIGHDGNGRMIDIPTLPDKIKGQRVKLAEHFYTCVESLICMKKITETLQPYEEFTLAAYLDVLNGFMAFHAHSGRIRDNSEKMLTLYLPSKTTEILYKLENVYQQRNVILHGKRSPLKINEGLFLIAPPMGKEESQSKWRSDMNWGDFNDEEFEHMEDYLNNALNSICQEYNSLISNLIEPIKKIVENNHISIDTIRNQISQSYGLQGPQGAIISGSTS